MKKISVFFLTCIFCVIFFLTQSLHAQIGDSNNNKGLSEADFQSVKKEYAVMSESKLQMEYDKTVIAIVKKLNNLPLKSFDDEKAFALYVKENLASTKFKDVEEAVNLRESAFSLKEQITAEYSAIFDALTRATQEQRIKILEKDFEKKISQLKE